MRPCCAPYSASPLPASHTPSAPLPLPLPVGLLLSPFALLPAAELFSFCRRSPFAASIAHTHTQYTHPAHTHPAHTRTHITRAHTHTHLKRAHITQLQAKFVQKCPRPGTIFISLSFAFSLSFSGSLSHSFCFVLRTFVYFSFGAGRLCWQGGRQHLRRIKF